MNTYADLELSLHRADASHYAVDFRFSQPESDADIRCWAQAVFDLPALTTLRLLPDEYAPALTTSLFCAEQDIPVKSWAIVLAQLLEIHCNSLVRN